MQWYPLILSMISQGYTPEQVYDYIANPGITLPYIEKVFNSESLRNRCHKFFKYQNKKPKSKRKKKAYQIYQELGPELFLEKYKKNRKDMVKEYNISLVDLDNIRFTYAKTIWLSRRVKCLDPNKYDSFQDLFKAKGKRSAKKELSLEEAKKLF